MAQPQRFYLHQPPSLCPYLCVVNQERWPFDFTDNRFKPGDELASLQHAIIYADGRPEERAAYGHSYSVEFDLGRLLEGSDPSSIPQEGETVTVHWLLQQGEEADVSVDKRVDHCHLRLEDGRFEPSDTSSREKLDESIAFAKRAESAEQYHDFILREIEGFEARGRRLAKAVEGGSVSETLRVLAEDLRYWAGNLKPHFYHHISHSVEDLSFVAWRDTPEGAPFKVLEHWIIRDWIGSHESYDLLEFHKSPEYARSFSDRLDKLHEARVEFAELLRNHTVESYDAPVDADFALDEVRRNLKHQALWLAAHIDRVAAQFDSGVVADESASLLELPTDLSNAKKYILRAVGKLGALSEESKVSAPEIANELGGEPTTEMRSNLSDLRDLQLLGGAKRSHGYWLSEAGIQCVRVWFPDVLEL